MTNLLGEPPETLLPDDTGAADLTQGIDVQNVAAAHPDSTLAWALLAEAALGEGRGRARCSHEPNQAFLRSLAALATASERYDDTTEAHRCREFLRESSPE